MIPQSVIDSILQHARIEEVVGDYVRLKKRGANFVGLCPFHNEKTPSMMVSPQKGIFKCFGCGAGGDSVKFIREIDNLSYPEALRKLATQYNIVIPETTEDVKKAKIEADERESLLLVNKFAADYFHHQLMETEAGKTIGQTYFKERGYNNAIINKFELGYAPEGFDNLLNAAKAKGYQIDFLLKGGLIKEKNGKEFDFFRDRVIFPIHNFSGKVVAFGARILGVAGNQPKYLNSPETIVYHKSRILYGLFFARQAIRQQNDCLLVEGYTDVLSLVQAGIEHVVASAGTALTEDQVRLMKRISEKITMIYDGDAAGINAALRGLEIVIKEGLDVKIVLLPDGEDPDSYVKSVGGEQFMKYVKENAKDFVFFLLDHMLRTEGKDPSSIAKAANKLSDIIALIPDPVKRNVYISDCAKKLGLPEELLFRKVAKLLRKTYLDYKKKTTETQEQSDLEEELHLLEKEQEEISELSFDNQEKDIIRTLLEFGNELFDEERTIAQYFFNEINAEFFKNEMVKKVFAEIKVIWLEKNMCPIAADFYHNRDKEISDFVVDLIMSLPEPSKYWMEKHQIHIIPRKNNAIHDVLSAHMLFNLRVVMQLAKQCREDIKLAEKEGKHELVDEKLSELHKLAVFQKQYAGFLNSVILK